MSKSGDALISASDITPGESVDSVSDLVNVERTRQIYRRREQVAEALAQGDTVRLVHGASREEVDLMIESRVRAYVLELGPLMRKAAEIGMTEENYWNDEPDVQTVVSPPAGIGGEYEGIRDGTKRVKNPDGTESEAPKAISVSGAGAKFLVDNSSPLRYIWQEEQERGGGTEFVPTQVETTIQRDAVLTVLQACDEFLTEIGLNLTLKGGEIDVSGSDDPF